MARQFIGVGGTGQHVALVMSRLMFLGAIPPGEAECTIIDGDEVHPLAKKLKTFDDYAPSADPAFTHPLGRVDAFLKPFATRAMAGGDANDTSFRALMLGTDAGGDDGAVFDALFDDEQKDQSVAQGFYAQPSLGATAFAAQHALEDNVLATLRARCEGAEKVFVTGSFIGGTGAGVIPALVASLGDSQRWFGAFLLRWMDAGQAAGDGVVTTAAMDTNMRHGLDYFYSTVRPHLCAAALLGPPPTAQTALISAAPQKSGETPSYYHLVAARAYFKTMSDSQATWNNAVLTFAHDEENPTWLLDQDWAGRRTLRTRLQCASRAADWLQDFCEPVPDKAQALASEFGLFGLPEGIPPGLSGLKAWWKRGRMGKEEFVRALFENLEHRKIALRSASRYFADMFPAVGEHAATRGVDAQAGLEAAWSARIAPPEGVNEPAELVARLGRELHAQLAAHLLERS